MYYVFVEPDYLGWVKKDIFINIGVRVEKKNLYHLIGGKTESYDIDILYTDGFFKVFRC